MTAPDPALDAALDALSRPALADALNELVASREVTLFQSARSRLQEQDAVVAVMGRQGVGKSTLMSALVGRRLFPIDETETTNVICRVRGAGGSPERAVVTFADGRSEDGPANEDFLRQYTDEQVNQGNRLGVSQVDVYLESSFLPPGLVLADTPGVGSLTASTAQVTMDFLPRISLGVFLMGTAPTLLHSEQLFLRATWGFSRSFLFVQNAWASSATELEDARRDNLAKLERIARDEGYGGAVDLLLVDAHDALEGQCNDDLERVEESGLSKLIREIASRAAHGARAVRIIANVPAILEVLAVAQENARNRRTSLDQADLEDERAFQGRQREAYEELDAIGRRWNARVRQFSTSVDQGCSELREAVHSRVTEAEERLVVLARERKMSVDKLAEAVSEQLTFAVKAPVDEYQRQFGQLVKEFLEDAGRMQLDAVGVSSKVPGIEDAARQASVNEKASKAGAVVSYLGQAGVGLILVGAAFEAGAVLVAGEGLAAALAAGGAAIPGVGIGVAAAALLGGYLLKKWQEGRALDKLIPSIGEAARTARGKIAREVVSGFRDRAAKVEASLDERMKRALEQQRAVLEQMGQDRARSTEEQSELRERLERMHGQVAAAISPVQALLVDGAGGRA